MRNLFVAGLVCAALFAPRPAAAQMSVSGGITFSGTITISTTSPSTATTPPNCGINSNATTFVPTASTWENFVPPAVGSTYTDGTSIGWPSNGCAVTRVTNTKGTSACAANYYATKAVDDISHFYIIDFNCNSGAYSILAGPLNNLYSLGTVVLSESQLSSTWSHESEPTWDRSTAGQLWYTLNNQIYYLTVNNAAKTYTATLNHTFTEYAGYRISFMDETDISPDGWLVTVGQNVQGGTIDDFLWNPTTLTKSPVYTTTCTADVNSANNSCLHKQIAAPVEGIIVQFANNSSCPAPDVSCSPGTGTTGPENGNRLWQSPWTTPLPYIQNQTGHLDEALVSGSQVYPTEDPLDNTSAFGNCPSGFNPTTFINGNYLTSYPGPNCQFYNSVGNPGWHISTRSSPLNIYSTYSAQANTSAAECFNNAGCFAAPSSANWIPYLGEIDEVRVDANNNTAIVYRLALSHSRGNPGYFWSDPRASRSYDGKYIYFTSNSAWSATGCGSDGGGDCGDIYMIGPIR